ncbi:hypothetical protein [Sciscionella marina]|uniref:hypothetical protein n=1 Tax=Sciscionella marina TaxID=508770 RepID=UPI000379BF42|nr:hypothetical protein [Sciscionella marina]
MPEQQVCTDEYQATVDQPARQESKSCSVLSAACCQRFLVGDVHRQLRDWMAVRRFPRPGFFCSAHGTEVTSSGGCGNVYAKAPPRYHVRAIGYQVDGSAQG